MSEIASTSVLPNNDPSTLKKIGQILAKAVQLPQPEWMIIADQKITEAKKAERVVLPEGYSYASDDTTHAELSQLSNRVGWNISEFTEKAYERHKKVRGIATIKVGVRDEAGQLVGYGAVAYRRSSGELQDFMVDPQHQSKGIGKAIIDERLRLAEAAGIDSLYMPYLERTNNLQSYYAELGFTKTDQDEIVRGPDPHSLRTQH